jgi:PIN domain nuclease of toxin-antitoxin system
VPACSVRSRFPAGFRWDRYCLALAKREGVPALTAERRRTDIAAAAGVTVELIR